MLTVTPDLSGYVLAAGEPFLLEVQLQDSGAAAIDLSTRAFILSFYGPGRTLIDHIDPEVATDATGPFLRFARDGRFSDSLYGQAVTVELAERYRNGREVLATGLLAITASSAGVVSFENGVIGRFVVRATLKADATTPGVLSPSIHIRPYGGDSVPPAPVFTTAPAISGTAKVGAILTGQDGTVANGAVSLREWLLNGTAISDATMATYQPVKSDADGRIAYRVTAQGTGGSVRAVSGAVTIAAADAPRWSTAPSLSATPQVGVATAAGDGTIVGGAVSARQWLLDGVSIDGATGTIYTPVDADAGKALAIRITATGDGGTATATAPALVVATQTLTVMPSAWPYADDFEDAAAGTNLLTRSGWSATGNAADRYRIGSFANGKAVYNDSLYRAEQHLTFGPDLNTDGSDFGFEVEIDENRAGNASAKDGNAYEGFRQSFTLFDRGDGDYVKVSAGDTGILPRVQTATVAGAETYHGVTFSHALQTAPAALGGGTASVRTLFQYHKGRLRTRLMGSGDWALYADALKWPFDALDVAGKVAGLSDLANRHGRVGLINGVWTYPLLNGLRIRPLRMVITSHARFCSRTTATSGIGRLWIKGNHRGTPTRWAYRLRAKPANTVVQDWQACSDVTLDTGAGSFALTVTIPQGGPYEVELAMTDSDGVTSNSWTKRVACGLFYITNGQSNSTGRGGRSVTTTFNPQAASQAYVGSNQGVPAYEMAGLGTNELPVSSGIETARTLSDALGIPCLVLSTGIAGSPIGGIIDSTNFAAKFGVTRALVDGWVDGVLWDQGEGDRDGAAANSGYADQLDTAYQKMVATTGNADLPMWISPIGRFASASPPGYTWTRIDAQTRPVKLGYEQVIAKYPGKVQYADSKLGTEHGDAYHYTAAAYDEMMRRWGRSILKYRGAGSGDGRGPIPTGLTRAGAVLTLAIDLNGATGLTDLIARSTATNDVKGVPALSGGLYGYEVSADGFASLLAISGIVRSGSSLVLTLAADPGTAVQIRSFHGASYDDRQLFWGTYAGGLEMLPVFPITRYLTSD